MINDLKSFSNPLPPDQRWLSLREINEMFGLSTSTIWRLRESGQLKASKLTRKVLINMQDMLDLLSAKK